MSDNKKLSTSPVAHYLRRVPYKKGAVSKCLTQRFYYLDCRVLSEVIADGDVEYVALDVGGEVGLKTATGNHRRAFHAGGAD